MLFRSNISLKIDEFDSISAKTPTIATLKPGGAPIRLSCKTTADFWLMSSVAGTMRDLSTVLNGTGNDAARMLGDLDDSLALFYRSVLQQP